MLFSPGPISVPSLFIGTEFSFEFSDCRPERDPASFEFLDDLLEED